MSVSRMEKLTPELEALISVYREKWRSLALSTEPIDRQKASYSVIAAYAAIGFKQPEIIFCDSPKVALNAIRSDLRSLLGRELESQLRSGLRNGLRSDLRIQLRLKMRSPVRSQLRSELRSELRLQLDSQLRLLLVRQLRRQLWLGLGNRLNNCIHPELWACSGSWIEYCISVFNCIYNPREWEVFQSLVSSCGWIFPYEKICLVCDRPIKLSFDDKQRLHGSGEPAIQFADGYSLYAYHGAVLPEKYGNLHPHQWRSQWLLSEDNAEVRRVLIQGIGYGRICSELQATELDTWQEYTLLKINDRVDEEPIFLLKMTCPSTGFIHVLRVPPDMKSAREAIAWVNWETDTEEFSAQS